MNSYLVRIYRRSENNPTLLIGVATEVGKAEKKAFSNLYELWDIINPKDDGPSPKKKRKGAKKS